MKKITFIMLLMMLSSIGFSQKDTTIYYSIVERTIKSKDSAYRYFITKKIKENTLKMSEYHRNNYDKKNLKWSDATTYEINKTNDSTYLFTELTTLQGKSNTFTRVFKKLNDGYMIQEFKGNHITSFGYSYLVFPLIKEGEWTYYYPNNLQERTIAIYKENQAISNRNWFEDGDETYTDIFSSVEIMPEFIGGMDELSNFLKDNITYPDLAREDGTSGVVYITFIVMEDGSINNIKVLRGIGSGCDEEAMRVVKLMNGKWKPGYINNKRVRVQFNLPIQYRLR